MPSALTATGLQIAVLILLAELLVAISAGHIARAVAWPRDHFFALANLLEFGAIAAVLFGVRPLRQYVQDELSRPIPRAMKPEVLLVAVLKPTIAFGAIGALALYHIALWPQADLARELGLTTNPAAANERFYSALGLAHAILIGLIAAPVLEEILYRGIVYRAFERQWGWVSAMLATSALFGALHPSHVVTAFLGSIVYICLLRRSGTLWAPILAHCLYNLLVSWPVLGHVLLARPRVEAVTLSGWTPELLCLAVAAIGVPLYVWLARQPREEFPVTVVLTAAGR
jgi:membrane protease YdiL (CAAX protease family)